MTITVLLSLIFDALLGEPRRFHPLVLFGKFAQAVEQRFNCGAFLKLRGSLATLSLIAAASVLGWGIEFFSKTLAPFLSMTIAALVVYLCIGMRSLAEHALLIHDALAQGNIIDARSSLAKIVSRDSDTLDENAISKAACESVLENGSDAIFAALFWFLLAGLPGVLAYRASNTLDAMWGYKNDRFLQFGWAAARLDDIANYIPARLTAISYALCGQRKTALRCWSQQGGLWESPNAGPVMAAGAGSLGVLLGGDAIYRGQLKSRPDIGVGRLAQALDIKLSLQLVARAVVLWLLVIAVLGCILGN